MTAQHLGPESLGIRRERGGQVSERGQPRLVVMVPGALACAGPLRTQATKLRTCRRRLVALELRRHLKKPGASADHA